MSELTTTLSEAFDTANEEGSKEFEPLPKGGYVAVITDAKVGPLKSGKGQAIQVTWEVEGDEKYAGRLIFDRIIIAHESADAMKFGRQKLKDIAVACGVTEQITDLSVLRLKPCLVSVKIETDDTGEYAPKNRVTRVKKIGDAKPKANGGDIEKEFNDKIPF
ncbi:MAG TPA: DUF669 domain-containing protein [Pseudolabrys sp.]|jgi:hypothetical protein|nr:DUF669 domain-containing protein [Pseudolabrys sp.]